MIDAYSNGFRVLVCGGQDYQDRARVFAALDAADARRRIGYLLHGDADGADALASDWAEARQRPHEIRRDPAACLVAGAEPHALVAFPGGPDVAAVVRCVKAAGIPVWQPYG